MSGIDDVTWFFQEYGEPIEKLWTIIWAIMTVAIVAHCGIWFYQNCIEWNSPTDAVDSPVTICSPTPSPSPSPEMPILQRNFKPYGTFYQYPDTIQYNSSIWIDPAAQRVYLEEPEQVQQVYNPDRAGHAIENQYYTVYTQSGISRQGYYDPARNVIYTIIRDDIFAE